MSLPCQSFSFESSAAKKERYKKCNQINTDIHVIGIIFSNCNLEIEAILFPEECYLLYDNQLGEL